MFSDSFESPFPVIYPTTHRQLFNTGDKTKDEKFSIKLDVGQFKPVEVSVRVDGNKITVVGKHQNKNKNGSENLEFSREYEIPPDVEPNSIVCRITSQGILLIEGDAKKDDPKSNILTDAIDVSDATSFHVYVNILGFKPEEVGVKLSGNDLVIEGKHSTEAKAEDGKKRMRKTKGFVYSFIIPPDVDINNMIPKFSTPYRLDIEAPRLARKPDTNEKNLEIKGVISSTKN